MGVNQPVLDIAYISNDLACNKELQQILGAFANPLVPATPRFALEEWQRSPCEHGLVVIDGYSLGREALGLCRRLRLAGVSKPIILAWLRDTALDRALCGEFGASAVISKPFDLKRVASCIRTAATGSATVEPSYGLAAPVNVLPRPPHSSASMVNARESRKAEPVPVG